MRVRWWATIERKKIYKIFFQNSNKKGNKITFKLTRNKTRKGPITLARLFLQLQLYRPISRCTAGNPRRL